MLPNFELVEDGFNDRSLSQEGALKGRQGKGFHVFPPFSCAAYPELKLTRMQTHCAAFQKHLPQLFPGAPIMAAGNGKYLFLRQSLGKQTIGVLEHIAFSIAQVNRQLRFLLRKEALEPCP